MYTFMITMSVLFCLFLIGSALALAMVVTETVNRESKRLIARINEVDQELRGRCHILELKIGLTPKELKQDD